MLKEFAKKLNDRQYNYPQFTKEELQYAKDNNIVIVYGVSDDLMEFDGAIYDEGGCFDGGYVWFNINGVVEEDLGQETDRCIEAVWRDKKRTDKNGSIITWTYKTDIPHETFMIYEDDEPYCEAIVFSIDEIR